MEIKTSTTEPEQSSQDEISPLMEAIATENCFFKYVYPFLLPSLAAIIFLSIPFILKTPDDLTPTFHVNLISLSSLNVSLCQISSKWNVNFIVKNPEHGKPVFYDAIRVSILYENEYCLSIGNIESFYQRNGQESMVHASLGGSSENVEKWVVSAVQTDMNTRRDMEIVLVLDALVIVNPGSEKYIRKQPVKVLCKNLKVKLSLDDAYTAGSMTSSDSRYCFLKFEDAGWVHW